MIDVVLPVLDEAGALPWVLGRLLPGYHAVVVDNGSSDGSAEIAAGLGATVIHESRRGYGAAVHAGLLAATTELVGTLDADGSLDPADLPALASPVLAGAADLVLGARISATGAWPLHARIANRALARSVGRRTGAALSDLGPMRVARRADLLGLDIADRRSGWPLEAMLRAGAAGWRIVEVPVPYGPRTGRSKVTGTVRGTLRAVHDMRGVLARA